MVETIEEEPKQIMKFGGLSVKAFDLVLEYMNFAGMTQKEILNLRRVNKSFDEEMYELMQRKSGQLDELKFILSEQKASFEPEGKEVAYFKEYQSIQDRMNEDYEECNKTRATIEFSSYLEPPDYIYRISEVILEITG